MKTRREIAQIKVYGLKEEERKKKKKERERKKKINFFFNATATTEIYTLSLHDALPIWKAKMVWKGIIDRYREYLPVKDRTPLVTLNEGNKIGRAHV